MIDFKFCKTPAGWRISEFKPNTAQDAVGPSLRGHPNVMRAFMRSAHMLDSPNGWIRKPEIIATVLAMRMTPKPFKKHLYQEIGGVERSALLAIAAEKALKRQGERQARAPDPAAS